MENKKILNKNLLVRILTSLVLIPLVLSIIYTGGTLFNLTIIMVAILMGFEWDALTNKNRNNKNPILWRFIGLCYISIPCISLLYIADKPQGSTIITWLLITVWAADTAAFFTGKIVGGPKLAPKISPKKTWSGFFGAISITYFVGLIAASVFTPPHPNYLILLTITLAIYAQIGDLLESWIKRK